MPYNPYLPAYGPYYSYQPQAVQQQPQTSGIIWISGLQEAQMYPVAPNNAVALWEQSGKVVYLKQADATGKPTLTIYDLVERTQNASAPQEVKSIEYVSKEELTKIVGVLDTVRSELETVKGDLYGVAGRKKKKEVNDDDE